MERKHLSKAVFCLLLTFVFAFTTAAVTLAPVDAATKKGKINKTKVTLYVKNTTKLKVTGMTKKVKWSSSNKKVAKVSSKGKVTALKAGTATITAKAGKKKLKCRVTVKNPTISARSATVYIDASDTRKETVQLTVSHAVGNIKWSSSNPRAAKVSSNGLVTAVRATENPVTITALASGVALKCMVTVDSTVGTCYIVWNTAKDLGKTRDEIHAEMRRTINQVFDRTYITESILGVNMTPATTLVARGIKGPDGSQFCRNPGYYRTTSTEDDCEAVISKQKEFGYTMGSPYTVDFPELVYIYHDGPGQAELASYMKEQLAKARINLKPVGLSWPDYLKALKAGDYHLALCGRIADVNDPNNFLEMFVSNSENNTARLEHKTNNGYIYQADLSDIGNYSDLHGTWADTYDRLIGYIKDETDPQIRTQLMHRAEDLLFSTGCICPLYYYTE